MLNQNNSFIISCFRQFYQHLLLEKSHIMKYTYVEQAAEKEQAGGSEGSEDSAFLSNTNQPGSNKLVEQVTSSLERLFDQQLEDAHDQGGQVLGSYYKKAQFVMVALADEVFLNMDWLERDTWEDNLLEIKFFNTRHAGTAIFDQIKTLIKEKSDRFDRELGQILFWTLGVGFLGKFRDQTNRQELQKYKEDLYRYVLMEKPIPIEQSSQKICPEAYRETQYKNIRYLPSPRIYMLAGLVALGVYVLASTVVWNHETYILSEKVDEINSTAEKDLRRK
ncbi:MAG: hypothetical protein CMM87_00835 [Rickettsiales bacterium]|nr:hypothetical protein [Rickettsiales bacterium]|tara:strand:- start:22252 stop:23085 length:834 start_codon:yes stop_codon:yes gene_type:complete